MFKSFLTLFVILIEYNFCYYRHFFQKIKLTYTYREPKFSAPYPYQMLLFYEKFALVSGMINKSGKWRLIKGERFQFLIFGKAIFKGNGN